MTTNDHQITMNDNSTSDIDSLIQQIESSQTDITSTYETWLRILFALADHFGESGRDYAHRISKFHPGYKPSECDKQFSHCLRSG
ncbi:PriCT-2 domain-containing protein, partial [bacterium]|nr:PriCT-2 domain-containing protein [bacterium]